MLKSVFYSLIILLVAISLSANTNPVHGIRDKSPSVKAFINANIIVSSDVKIDNGIMVIDNGIIKYVGTEPKIPAEAQIIDLEGYTIYPGFIDPFSNYGLKKPGKPNRNPTYLKFEATRTGGQAANDAIHAQIDWVDHFKSNKKESEKYIKNGFTVVQSARQDGIFRGRSLVTLLGENKRSGDLILHPYNLHFLSFNKGSSPQEYPNSLMGSIALIRQTFFDLNWYNSAHSAFEKNSNQPMPEFNSAIEAIGNYNNPVYIMDTEDDRSLLRADKIAREFNLDFIHLGSGYEYTRLDQLKATGASVILPLNFPKAPNVANYEDRLDVSLADLRHWETAPYNPAFLNDAGITFALTMAKLKESKNFLPNLRKAIKNGLSTKAALEALTITPARICNIDNLTGTLEQGKLANFIITNGDIFREEKSIHAVYIKGEKHKLKSIRTNSKDSFDGNYTLTFDKHTAELNLEDDLSKITGSVIINDDSLKLKNIYFEDTKLSFNFEVSQPELSGILSFSGRKELANQSLITGNGTYADGTEFKWTAVLKDDTAYQTIEPLTDSTSTDTTKSEKEIEPNERIAKISFPNKAFGRLSPPAQKNLHIKNIRLWTSEAEGIINNADVIIKDGKFNEIGHNLATPSGYDIIDGTGKEMTAGIFDAHSHIAINGGVNECTEAITAETRISDVINPDDINIYRQLSGGVTASHLIHGSCNPIGGLAQTIKLRWGSNAEDLKFKNGFPTIKFALGENVKRSGWGKQHTTRYPQSRMGVETIIRDELQTALEYERKWEDFYKLSKKQESITVPPRKDIELDHVLDILKHKTDIHCHSYVHTGILMMIRLAEQFNFKVRCFIHVLEGYKVASEMAEHGATGSGFSDWWAYKFEVYDAIPYNNSLMTEKGVLSSVNSDNADLARRLNQEAAKSIMYGAMEPLEAIKMATINPAKQLKIDDRIGSIKVGKDADFVIWNGSPLSIYTKAEQTWIDGKKYFDIDQDQIIRAEIKAEKNQLIQKILATKSKQSKEYKKDYKREDIQWGDEEYFDYWRAINEN